MCVIERIKEIRSISFAVFGKNSVNRTPGNAVAIVSKSPRISAGESGLGSTVSWWEAPPERKRMMQFLALPKLPDDAEVFNGFAEGGAFRAGAGF